jgi:cystathionine beta-lyase
MGQIACQAAYEKGEPWLESLLEYLGKNISVFRETLISCYPEIRLIEPEGTFLLWVDFSMLGRKDDEICNDIEKRAKLWLARGTRFGSEGSGFQRFNIACPQTVLSEALQRLRTIQLI